MALKVGELFASFTIDASQGLSTLGAIKIAAQEVTQFMRDIGIDTNFGLSDIVNEGKEFEKAMYDVFRLMPGITEATKEELTAFAREAGMGTVYSAKEAAEALGYMALAGWDADKMMQGLYPILNLATSGSMDLATASDIVTDDLTALGYTFNRAEKEGVSFGSYVEELADVFAMTSASSNTTVEMLGEAMKFAAPAAAALGYSMEDVSIALGMMANSGVKSGMAGRALRNVFTNLINPSTEAKKSIMNVFDIDLADEAGNVIGFIDLIDQLRVSFAATDDNVAKEIGRMMYLINDMLDDMDVDSDDIMQTVKAYENEGLFDARAVYKYIKLERELGKELDEVAKKYGLSSTEYAQKEQEVNLRLIDEFKGITDGQSEQLEMLAAVSELFGQQAMSGVLALILADQEEYDTLKEKVYGAEGAAEEMAATNLDNLAGSITILNSELSELKIALSESINPLLRQMVDAAAGFLDHINHLGEGVLTMSEVQEVVNSMDFSNIIDGTEDIKDAADAAKAAGKELAEAQSTINSMALMIQLKVGVDSESEQALSFVEEVEKVIKAGLSTIEANQYYVNVSMAGSMSQESYDSLNSGLFLPYYAMMTEQATAAGEAVRQAMVEAMTDGTLSAEESARIALMTEQYTQQVEQAIADNKFRAQMNRMIAEANMQSKDYESIAKEAEQRIQEYVEQQMTAKDSVINAAYEAAAYQGLSASETQAYVAEISEAFDANTQSMIADVYYQLQESFSTQWFKGMGDVSDDIASYFSETMDGSYREWLESTDMFDNMVDEMGKSVKHLDWQFFSDQNGAKNRIGETMSAYLNDYGAKADAPAWVNDMYNQFTIQDLLSYSRISGAMDQFIAYLSGATNSEESMAASAAFYDALDQLPLDEANAVMASMVDAMFAFIQEPVDVQSGASILGKILSDTGVKFTFSDGESLFDYGAMADAISSRPIVITINGREFAEATASENSGAIGGYESRVAAGTGKR